MQAHFWRRALVAAAILGAPLFAGDYDHLFGVIRDTWPEKNVLLSLCNKDANEMTLIDLADSAKAKGLSLIIMDIKDEKAYNATMTNALSKNPGVLLILEDDPLTGLKGHLTTRMIYRVGGREIPAVALSKDLLKLGGALATGSGADDPVYVNKEVIKRLKINLPDKCTDPSEKK
jgi:CheY-like chemotaxis protein